MLTALSIHNVVLIDRLDIEFRPGLCALTGETGAGKSILLDALGLALGGRSDSGLVRKGAEHAQVSAEFHIAKNHPCYLILHNANIEGDANGELVLRRSISADGRSRAFINDQPVSVALLREIGDTLVEIHGQFETQGLLNPASHGRILDVYADAQGACAAPWEIWKAARAELQRLQESAGQSRAEEEYLRQAVEDLDSLEPKPGEEKGLGELRERLMHRERVLEGLNAAYHVLRTEDDPVQAALSALHKIAGRMGSSADEALAALGRAAAEMEAAISEIQSLSADLQESEHDLESIDDRLHALRAQARKHGCAVDDLAEKREELAAKLNHIEHEDEFLARQIQATDKARKDYIAQAEKLCAQRQRAAKKLDELVKKELTPLKLEKARFFTQLEALEESEWGPGGMDRVRFLAATNPGTDPGPLNKIASGGEMARFMLALKVVMAETGGAGTLIFDEVDAGVGGGTADAVGERLARLAEAKQILVVTHSPQVAARAGNHYIVRKAGAKDLRTDVIHLQDTHRREEIARMLAGATITDEARAAADRLLETGT